MIGDEETIKDSRHRPWVEMSDKEREEEFEKFRLGVEKDGQNIAAEILGLKGGDVVRYGVLWARHIRAFLGAFAEQQESEPPGKARWPEEQELIDFMKARKTG